MNSADRRRDREKHRVRRTSLALKNYCMIVETCGLCGYPDRLWFCNFSKRDESGGGCKFMFRKEFIECTCEEAIADAMMNKKLEDL